MWLTRGTATDVDEEQETLSLVMLVVFFSRWTGGCEEKLARNDSVPN